MPTDVVRDEQLAEPTLGALLTRVVRTTVPTRLYRLLHLAFPLAVDFGLRAVQVIRAAAGTLAAALAALLVLELFLRLLGNAPIS